MRNLEIALVAAQCILALFAADSCEEFHFHNYKSEVIEVTCEQDGYTLYTCECGDSYREDIVPAKGHQKEGVGEIVSPTCTEGGGLRYTCSVCGVPFFDPDTAVPALGHDIVTDYGYPATCTAEGLTEGSSCSRCEAVLVPQFPIAKLSHTPSVTKEGVPATCLEAGFSEEIKCSVCGALIQARRSLAPLGHLDADADDFCDRCDLLTATDYQKISSASELMNISADLYGKYILTQDISLSGVNWTPLGTESEPFMGTLYGNGHSIKGLSFSNMTGALFRYNSGKIVGLRLEGLSLSSENKSASLGGIAVYNRGSIIDCTITGFKAAFRVIQSKTTSYPNYDGGSVGASGCIGGFCAYNEGIVRNCAIEGNYSVTVTVSSYFELKKNPLFFLDADYRFTVNVTFCYGGIAGENRGEIASCKVLSASSIVLTSAASSANTHGTAYTNLTCNVGTIAGKNDAKVTSCAAQRATVTKYQAQNCTLNVTEYNELNS